MSKILHSFAFWIIVAVIFLLPFGQLTRIDLFLPCTFYAHDILLGILGIFGVVFSSQKQKSRASVNKGIGIFVIIATVSLLFALPHLSFSEFFISAFYLLRWGVYALLYSVIISFSLRQRQLLLSLLFVSGVIFAFLGLLQYGLYPNLRNLYYAGWDPHLYRLFSTFFDPNFAGIYLVLTFFLGLARVFRQKKTSIFVFVALGMILIALLLTYSRSSYLAFFAGLCVLGLVKKKLRTISVAFVVLVCVGVVLLPRPFGEGVRLERTNTFIARVGNWTEAIDVFRKSPGLGVGFNTYAFRRTKVPKNSQIISHSVSGVDNSYLFVLATTGIIGFFGYSYLWFLIIRQAFANENRNTFILLSMIVPVMLHALFVNTLFYSWIMIWVWIVLASTEVMECK